MKMKTLIEWLLSKLFPVSTPELSDHPSDNFIPSAVLIQVVKDPEQFKRICEV